MRRRVLAVALVAGLLLPGRADAWGFEGHRLIMERAIVLLPAELRPLFERFRATLVERSIDPDTWRIAGFKDEDPHHFINVDAGLYGKDPFTGLPRDYAAAAAKFGEAEVVRTGTLPWRIEEFATNLQRAFESYARRGTFGRNDILFFAAWTAHYVADVHQPFHCAANYDGQLTGQTGVHSRFETALVERYASQLRVTPMPIPPVRAPRDFAFEQVLESNRLVPAILKADRDALSGRDAYDDVYFAAFFRAARPVLERRLDESIAAVAAIIAGAWEAAGRPPVPVTQPPQPLRRVSRP
jgi:hypothetical protein